MTLRERYQIEQKGRQLLEDTSYSILQEKDYDGSIVKSEVLDFLQSLESRTGPIESSLPQEAISWLLRYNYISRTPLDG